MSLLMPDFPGVRLTAALNCGMIFVYSITILNRCSVRLLWNTTEGVRFIGIGSLRIGFILLAIFLGYHLGLPQIADEEFPWLGVAIGVTLAAGIIAIERGAR